MSEVIIILLVFFPDLVLVIVEDEGLLSILEMPFSKCCSDWVLVVV